MRNIENESVRSDRTDRSDRNRGHRSHSREGKSSHRNHDNSNRDHHQKRHTRRSRSGDGRSREDRSVTINAPSGDEANEDGSRYGGGRPGPYSNGGIEVSILPQNDDRWDAATAVTDATSAYTGYSLEDLTKIEKPDKLIGSECGRWVAPTFASIISLVAFLSPIAMVILPKTYLIPGFFNQTLQECGTDMSRCKARLTREEEIAFALMQCQPECEGLLISFAFKLFILLLGAWALFFRAPKASLPRVFMFRALVLFLVFVLTFSFWLFYGVRVIQDHYHDYNNIVTFAVSLVDALLFVHYLAIILLEIRHLSTKYIVKMSRSPDGETRTITMGELSIQRAAVHCLEQYYKEFPTYNPFLENLPGARGGGASVGKGKNSTNASKFKVYNLDGDSKGDLSAQTAAITAINSRRSDRGGHNDRFYEELEYERRVRKRKSRLIIAAEDAFTHIRRLGQRENAGPAIPMDPHEAAQAIFPSMARALQKYLRITRQQPWHTMDSVLRHLATCIQHDMTPKAFLQKYFKEGSVLHQSDKAVLPTEQWVLVCDHVLSRTCEDGIQFQLKQADVSLLCQVKRIPHISLLEEVVDAKKNRFVLRLNSETSV